MSVSSINAQVASYQTKVSDLKAQAQATAETKRDEADSKKQAAATVETKQAENEATKAPVREGVGKVVDISV